MFQKQFNARSNFVKKIDNKSNITVTNYGVVVTAFFLYLCLDLLTYPSLLTRYAFCKQLF